MKDRNMYANYYVIKNLIKFKFQDNANMRNQLLEELSTKEVKRLVRAKFNKHPYQSLTEEDVVKVIENFQQEKHRMIFIIQLKTGVRIGDVLSLTYECAKYNIVNGKSELSLTLMTKGDKPRTVLMYDGFATIVNDYINTLEKISGVDFYVFLTGQDRKQYAKSILSTLTDGAGNALDAHDKLMDYNYQQYLKDFHSAFALSGLDSKMFATHYMRRKFARKVWDKYKDVDKLKRAMGHADINTSLGYLRQSGQDAEEIFKELSEDD
jgi:integrase